MNFPPSITLGTILAKLPSCFRYDEGKTLGILIQIRYAYAFGYANQLWRKKDAVKLAFASNLTADAACGHGNKAAKREAQLALKEMHSMEPFSLGLSPEAVDDLAETYKPTWHFSPQEDEEAAELAKDFH